MRAVIEESTLISSGKFVHGPTGRKIRERKRGKKYEKRKEKIKKKKKAPRMIA